MRSKRVRMRSRSSIEALSVKVIAGSFGDYAMPRADDLPELHAGFHDVPCTTNPLGVKGIGEGGAIGAPPADSQNGSRSASPALHPGE